MKGYEGCICEVQGLYAVYILKATGREHNSKKGRKEDWLHKYIGTRIIALGASPKAPQGFRLGRYGRALLTCNTETGFNES